MSGRKLASVSLLVILATPWTAAAQSRAGQEVEPLGFSTGAYRVVVHKDHLGDTIDRKALANIFLGIETKWGDGTAIAPVEQSLRSVVRAKFAQEILKRSPAAVLEYWKRELQRGTKRPPGVKASDGDVLTFVASRPGAIGYVSGGTQVGESVKVLRITG